MDPFNLRDRLTRYSNLTGIKYETLRERWQAIEDLPPEKRCQINPIDLKPVLNLSDEDMYEFFLKLVQVELLIPRWCLVDPFTGFYIKTWPDFASIYTEREFSPFISDVIDIDIEKNLEVCFQVAPGIYADEIHPYDDYQSYITFLRSLKFHASEEVEHYLGKENTKFFQVFNSFELGKIPLEAEAGKTYRIISPETQGVVLLRVAASPQQASFLNKMVLYRESKTPVMPGMGKPAQSLEVELNEDGFKPKELTCKPGRVEIWVQSNLKKKTGVLTIVEDTARLKTMIAQNPPTFDPFLTAKFLLSSRAYKEYNVLSQTGAEKAFPVTDLTILFAEMEPNFELYDVAGDQKAFHLIQEMLSALEDLVTLTNGVVVRTLGTLIMAIFHNPSEGALSCEKIMDKIISHNKKNTPEKHLSIKAAMHYGEALAVKVENSLDYFGKLITTAIRLQSQAEGMELVATQELVQAWGKDYVLNENGWEVQEKVYSIQEGIDLRAYSCRRSPKK